MIQQISTSLNVSPSAVHLALVFAVLTAICGYILAHYFRLLVFGSIAAFVLLAYLRSNNSPIPQAVHDVGVAAAASIDAAIANISK